MESRMTNERNRLVLLNPQKAFCDDATVGSVTQSIVTLPVLEQALMETDTPPESRLRATKRKLDDAFHLLDRVVTVGSTSTSRTEPPTPPKKPHAIRSVYSTLSKYGLGPKETSQPRPTPRLSKATPNLSAILTRAASRTKSTFTFRFNASSDAAVPALPPGAEYRPSSLSSFLSRLASFKLSTYANKPASIDAVAAAKCGWSNDGKDRLVCGLCNASWVVIGREGLTREAANALVEKQRVSLVESHKNGCPWRSRQCDDAIYCIPLKPSSIMVSEMKENALKIEAYLNGVSTKHPLTQSQVHSLVSIVNSSSQGVEESQPDRMDVDSQRPPRIPDAPILASLFGWSLVPPTRPLPPKRASLSTRPSRSSTPAPSDAPSPTASPMRSGTPKPFKFQVPSLPKPENALLQCELCQRRVGLWAFMDQQPKSTAPTSTSATPEVQESTTPAPQPSSNEPVTPKKAVTQRSFDLLREHRSYCPYVVRSTVVPSPPVPQTGAPPPTITRPLPLRRSTSSLSTKSDRSPSNAVEGWKAILTIILRSRLAKQQRIEYTLLSRANTSPDMPVNEESSSEVDSVKAMVDDVKARGGRDLLRYVRQLLG